MSVMYKAQSVYLIDDDEIFQFATKRYIEIKKLSKRIEVFANGKRALDHILAQKKGEDSLLPEIILLDLNMPVMDGWDFLMEMEKLDVSIKENTIIYILSSSIDDKDIARAHAISLVKDYVIKPVDEEKLSKIFNC